MKCTLIYATPNYHKLVETVARVCYQSYHKDDVNSHNFIKGIMSKGHLSVASVGNLVFEIILEDDNNDYLIDLLTMYEINNFVKQTDWQHRLNVSINPKISMNMLTFLDIYEAKGKYIWATDLLDLIIAEIDKVPCLKWFYDKTVELPEIKNEYTAKGRPKLYEPIVLDEDYTALKALGLNDYELGVHSTVTMNFITDRSASLQFWRHAIVGGCELSQRYVKRDQSEYRPLIGVSEEIQRLLDVINKKNLNDYQEIYDFCKSNGIRDGRAKEIARSVLSNGIFTQCIQCRPYRYWMHLFKLRDSKHAQREIQEDVIHMKRVLNELNVPTE